MVELQDTFKCGCAPKDHENGLNIKLRNLLLKQIIKRPLVLTVSKMSCSRMLMFEYQGQSDAFLT